MLVEIFSTVNSQPSTAEKLYKVSDEVDAGVEEFRRKRARGVRVREVRDALGMSGDAFAARLMEIGAQMGHDGAIQLDKTIVSNIENGKRQLSVEEAAAIIEIDPSRRPVQWLVFGKKSAIEATESAPTLQPSPKRQPLGRAAQTPKKKASGDR
jgi:transcriptional regulator with XRE-family HTH domain